MQAAIAAQRLQRERPALTAPAATGTALRPLQADLTEGTADEDPQTSPVHAADTQQQPEQQQQHAAEQQQLQQQQQQQQHAAQQQQHAERARQQHAERARQQQEAERARQKLTQRCNETLYRTTMPMSVKAAEVDAALEAANMSLDPDDHAPLVWYAAAY